MAKQLALPTSDHGVTGSNPAGGEILPEPKRRFIAQSLSYSPFHRLEMAEILLKGCKTLTHPSILLVSVAEQAGFESHLVVHPEGRFSLDVAQKLVFMMIFLKISVSVKHPL